jgi:secondary thiamine-phosphate synthase enzyme
MKQTVTTIAFATTAGVELVDLTDRIRAAIRESGARTGLVTIVSRHTTGGIAVNEKEAALQQDMVEWLKKQFPKDALYIHNLQPRDGRPNAHGHLAGLVLRASETLPVKDGDLDVGKWQAVFFVECDGPREREVSVIVLGTA